MQPQSLDRRATSPWDISRVLDQFYKVFRINTSFGSVGAPDNMAGKMLTGTSDVTPDTEFSVTHNLQVIPIGYLILQRDKAGVFYNGATAWTASKIYLKCNVASVAYTIFVLI